MTVVDTPTFIQSGGESAEETRRSIGAILGRRGGIVGPNDLQVSGNAAGADMSVDVAGGQVIIPGSENDYQGVYICENRDTVNVPLAASDPSLNRYDIIVARVRDGEYSGDENSFSIEAVTGTPASSPSAPSIPDNSWMLARVAIAAGVSSITGANIVDYRGGLAGVTQQNGRAAALGGVIVCTSSTRPTQELYEGMMAYETNTDRVIVYDGSNWKRVADNGARNTYTPDWLQSVTINKTTLRNEYRHIGREVHGVVFMTATSAGTAGHAMVVSTPVTPAWTSNQVIGSGTYSNGSANFPVIVWLGTSGFVFIPTFTASTNFFGTQALFYTSGASANTSFTPTVASGHSLFFEYHYEASSAA